MFLKQYFAFILIAASGAAALVFVPEEPMSVRATKAYQLIHAHISRDASVAYEYGNMRFSAHHAAWYDVEAAERYFLMALERDPMLPYTHHQLARIEFLRGNFLDALILINRELAVNPDPSPSTYYIRGLIGGFAGLYDMSARDYETYLRADPTNWAAINDYAWVLLKANRSAEALEATARGLSYFPRNPWLLNSNAIALYEEGFIAEALDQAREATRYAMLLDEQDWLIAYPGNDPRVAHDGIQALSDSVRENFVVIRTAAAE